MMIGRSAARRVKARGTTPASLADAFATLSHPVRQEAVTPSVGSSGGFLASLGFGGGAVGTIPLTDPFPGTVEPQRLPPPSTPAKTEFTALSNGFRVASENAWGPIAGIGLAVAAGSQNERSDELGLARFLEFMSYRGTLNRTHFRVMQEINGCGSNVLANVSREQTYYSIECLKTDVAASVEVLCDAVFNPKFNPWEIEEALELAKMSTEEAKKNPEVLMSELLTAVAYQGGLGNPLLGSSMDSKRITAEKLMEFHAANFTPDRMVLSVAGMDHSELLKIAEPIAGILPKGEKYTAPISTYVGGEMKKPEDDEMCHVTLAFDIEGGWEDVKTACMTTVLMHLMGGGGSFSSGGPGKGMHSRLYLNVLTKYNWVHNFSAVTQAFDKRCLSGVYGAVPPEFAPKLVDVMTQELTSLAKDISDVEVRRAKNAAIGQILMTLESRSVAAEDIARQVLTYGHRKSTQVFIEGLEKVTKDDLKKLVANMLKTPLSMASMGNVAHVPRYAEIARRFG